MGNIIYPPPPHPDPKKRVVYQPCNHDFLYALIFTIVIVILGVLIGAFLQANNQLMSNLLERQYSQLVEWMRIK